MEAQLQLCNEIPFQIENSCNRKAMSKFLCVEPKGDEDLYKTAIEDWLKPGSSQAKQRIAIVGKSKIGKTQLLKKILNDVRSEYEYIFYVSLEFLDLSKEINSPKHIEMDGLESR